MNELGVHKKTVSIYAEAIELNKKGIHVISGDEKSGMPASEREITS